MLQKGRFQLAHTNEVIGSFLTAGARIHLYAFFDKLQVRAIYTDTGSIIYIQDDAEPLLIDCGDKLGSMTNVLQPGEFIEEFVSGGPKIMPAGWSAEVIPQRRIRRLYVRLGDNIRIFHLTTGKL